METIESQKTFISIRNHEAVPLSEIPVLRYEDFSRTVIELLLDPLAHCVNYYCFKFEGGLKFICCVAHDFRQDIRLMSHELHGKKELRSLACDKFALHIFEREIAENFGVDFISSPWKKPVRYAFNRADKSAVINNYPFYRISSDELHEVGVGPIHAGVIEPGHFRFLCNGETVLHLEIQLGWQHRGVEQLYLDKKTLLQRTIISESIAGDTSVGHANAFVNLIEGLANVRATQRLEIERTIALELERIAMHVGDLSNMNIGMAYQLASSVFGALRTPVINFIQSWCGNRFGKSLTRVGGTHYPLNITLIDNLRKLLDTFEPRFATMAHKAFGMTSVLMRMEKIGEVTKKQMELIGAVGMAARMAGVMRDIRKTHPTGVYESSQITTHTLLEGDVWARAMLRKLEVESSIKYVRQLLDKIEEFGEADSQKPIQPERVILGRNMFSLSLTEGWRGEICHSAVTNAEGEIIHYKVKDPSFHNWFALALSLRNLEISDFPINNKSYNLSYCGHDL